MTIPSRSGCTHGPPAAKPNHAVCTAAVPLVALGGHPRNNDQIHCPISCSQAVVTTPRLASRLALAVETAESSR